MTLRVRLAAALLCLVAILTGAALGLEAARKKDLTYDERYYVAFANDLAVGKSACGYTLHPPLSMRLAELGILLMGDRERGSVRTPHLILFILFGFLVATWSGMLYDARAAVAASSLYAFGPNLLAHASLATTDFPVTASFGMNLFALRLLLRRATVPRAFLWALTLAVAQMTKQTALLLLPSTVLIAVVLLLSGAVRWQRGYLWAVLLAPLVLVAVAYLAYGMSWCGLDIYRTQSALRITQNRTGQGYSIYVLGHIYDHGVWHYFLVTTALKEPLPFLALLVLGVFGPPVPRDGQRETAYLLIPAAVVFLAASASIHQLGHRYILPVFPLLVVWVSGLASAEGIAARRRQVPAVVVWGLLALYVADAFRIRPNYLAYFNQLIGSPENGYHYLADSNMDWLQDERVPEVELLKQRWDIIDVERSPLHFDPAKPPALLLGATELSGVWAHAGFWGSPFTQLVRERGYPHVASVGNSRFLFPLDSVPLYRDLYAFLLSRSWTDAVNLRHRFAALAGLQEPALPLFSPLRRADERGCTRGIRCTAKRDAGDEVTTVDAFVPPPGTTPVKSLRWAARWRADGGEYLFPLPAPAGAHPDGVVTLDHQVVDFERGSQENAPRFSAFRLEPGEHALAVTLPSGVAGSVVLDVSQVTRDPRGYAHAERVDLVAHLCDPGE